jgi:hypothetical protein
MRNSSQDERPVVATGCALAETPSWTRAADGVAAVLVDVEGLVETP